MSIASENRRSSDQAALCYIEPFEPSWAPTVAAWVQSEQELLWLAPATAPPLTAAKVANWSRDGRRAYVLRLNGLAEPIGYAELGPMPGRARQMWVGHFIIAPPRRRQGLGKRFLRLLLARAFGPLGANDVCLIVFPDNHAAIRCYQAVGFKPAGQERRYFEPTGCEHALIRMSIRLADYRRGRLQGGGAG